MSVMWSIDCLWAVFQLTFIPFSSRQRKYFFGVSKWSTQASALVFGWFSSIVLGRVCFATMKTADNDDNQPNFITNNEANTVLSCWEKVSMPSSPSSSVLMMPMVVPSIYSNCAARIMSAAFLFSIFLFLSPTPCQTVRCVLVTDFKSQASEWAFCISWAVSSIRTTAMK